MDHVGDGESGGRDEGSEASDHETGDTDGDDALRVGFAGDVMLGRGVDRAHADGPPGAVWGSLREHLHRLDGLVVNLECVLSERGEPWPDKRFHFRAQPSWAIDALRDAGVDVVTLANNHAMDFGAPALRDTLEHLGAAGIAHTGAGEDLGRALDPAIADVGDATLAAFGLVDHWREFAAESDAPGTAVADVDDEPERARDLAETAVQRAEAADPDLLVASLHLGGNYDTEPSDAHRRFARWLVDRGVDVVHGHSAHVHQGVEAYDGGVICYDAGEFVDDYADRRGYHNDRSFLFELVCGSEDGTLEAQCLRLVPIEIEHYRVHPASASAAAWLVESVRERSDAFGTTFERAGEGPALRVQL